MSTELNDDIAPMQGEEPAEPGAIQTTVVTAADDPQEPEAVELKPGELVVPLSVVKALRAEIKSLKPLAERAPLLEAELNQAKPYADFLRQNPQLLRPQAQPVAPTPPAEDKAATSLATRLQLFTADGRLDVASAQSILAETRTQAREEAQALMQPVQERTDMQSAEANLRRIQAVKDADGHPLEQAYIEQAIGGIVAKLPRAQALKVLADPAVADVIADVALGTQARSKKRGPAIVPPADAPLHVEHSGGGAGYVISENERRIAKSVGRTEKDWADGAKRYQPGKYNSLE